MSDINAPEEIKQVLEYLGRTDISGEFRDKHLGQTLIYMQQWKTGELSKTLNRLAIRLGITVRHVRENYIQPLESEGVITVTRHSKDLLWRWVGVPEDKTFMESVRRTESQKDDKGGEREK